MCPTTRKIPHHHYLTSTSLPPYIRLHYQSITTVTTPSIQKEKGTQPPKPKPETKSPDPQQPIQTQLSYKNQSADLPNDGYIKSDRHRLAPLLKMAASLPTLYNSRL